MNADRLLAHYEKFADAPDAIPRMRRFILDLAVRGKLVPQDPNDEPASELLKRIAAEKARLVSEGSQKEDRNPKVPPLRINLLELPRGWTWGALQSICLSISDGDHQPPPKSENGVPFLVIGDVRTKTINYDAERTVSQEYYDSLDPIRKPKCGDLLYTLVGSFGIPVPVLSDVHFCVQRHIGILRPSKQIDLRAAALFLESEFAFRQAESVATGIAQKTVSLAGLRSMVIPLPPLAEQRRIVAKVDELMALCDRLEAAREAREATRNRLTAASLARLNAPDPETFQADARFALDALPALTTRPDQIKAFRQTIRSLAVRGKLVLQDPRDQSARELLKQITADKAERAIAARDRRATQVEPIVGEEVPFPLPSTWLWALFGDITISRDGQRIPVSREERERRPKVYDYYGASGVIDKIDDFLFDKPLLLIGEDGANLINRSTPIAFIARGRYWVNNHAHVLDGISEEFLRYIELFINAIDLKPYVTGTAQPKMNQAKMNGIPIALPPLAEQQRIVAKVDELMGLCDQLETSLATADETRRRLLESLLAEALEPAESRAMEAAE